MASTHAPPGTTPPAMLAGLRSLVAAVIADEKSYNVPGLCVRLGMADGSVDDAHRSKFRYAQQRVMALDGAAVLAVAKALLLEQPRDDLVEAVANIEELPGPAVTPLTRRRLMALFDRAPLATELDHLDLIRKVWPIDAMPSGCERDDWTMGDRLFQHTVRNNDLSNREILEALGLLTSSRARLFRFLEEVTGPEAQAPNRQAELAGKIDALLVHDGYRLVAAGRMSGSPVYAVKAAPKGSPADHAISHTLKAFDPTDVAARWQEAMDSREASPGRAITLARTLLEDVCKWIITEARETYREADDLPALYRQLSKLLKLAPDDHTEQVFEDWTRLLGGRSLVVGAGL